MACKHCYSIYNLLDNLARYDFIRLKSTYQCVQVRLTWFEIFFLQQTSCMPAYACFNSTGSEMRTLPSSRTTLLGLASVPN